MQYFPFSAFSTMTFSPRKPASSVIPPPYEIGPVANSCQAGQVTPRRFGVTFRRAYILAYCSSRPLESHRCPLDVSWSRTCVPSETTTVSSSARDQASAWFSRPSSDHLSRPSSHGGRGSRAAPEPIDLLLEQGAVLAEPRRFARDLEEEAAEVAGDRALIGPDLLWALADHQRRPFARPGGADQPLADGGEETHHDLERLGLEVLEQDQAGDQLVHRRADLVRIAPRDPAGQLDQRDRSLRLLEHIDDPLRQRVLQLPGGPAGPSMVHDVAPQRRRRRGRSRRIPAVRSTSAMNAMSW